VVKKSKSEDRKRKDSHVDDVIASVIERGIAESKNFEVVTDFRETERPRTPGWSTLPLIDEDL
jgi:hypothetical protein